MDDAPYRGSSTTIKSPNIGSAPQRSVITQIAFAQLIQNDFISSPPLGGARRALGSRPHPWRIPARTATIRAGFRGVKRRHRQFPALCLDVICFGPQRVLTALVQFRGIHRASGADSDDSSGWEALFR